MQIIGGGAWPPRAPPLFLRPCKLFETLIVFLKDFFEKSKRGSFMVWEINMGVCPRLEFDDIMFTN